MPRDAFAMYAAYAARADDSNIQHSFIPPQRYATQLSNGIKQRNCEAIYMYYQYGDAIKINKSK
jgi:hypothetical protein